jgi:hypothetical protein
LSEAINGRRRNAPFFRPDQIDSMHKAFEQVRTRMRLTGAKALPVVELVAIRIVELACGGEFDPDKLTKDGVSLDLALRRPRGARRSRAAIAGRPR